MNKKIIISVFIVLVAVAASLGATFAWFTAATDPIENVFEAGTVGISADEKVSWSSDDFAAGHGIRENWNPGDCDWKLFRITNTDSKGIYLRASFTGKWEGVGSVTVGDTDNLEWWLNQNVTVISAAEEGATAWDFISHDTTYNEGEWVVVGDSGSEEWFTAYYYFKGPVPGTFEQPDVPEGVTNPARQVLFYVKVCVDGPDTGNEYQGKQFKLSGTFEAIQRSHEAAFEEWGAGFHDGQWYPVVDKNVKVNNTIYFDDADNKWKLQDNNGATLVWGAHGTDPNVKSFQLL